MKSNNYVLIMAGGVGSRFWPKSRNNNPKQFLDVLGVGKSLLQLTYNRFQKLCPKENIYIVTNKQYENIIFQQLDGINVDQIICEPSRNNTAPCIAYASFKLKKINPDANIVVTPSDHFILYEDIFIKTINEALSYTFEHDALVTIGIKPSRPDTGYGYIKYDDTNPGDIHKVTHFKEKPSLNHAQIFLKEGNYVWNAGIFIWKVESILNALKIHSNSIFELFKQGEPYYNTSGEVEFINSHYHNTPNISIDYAIMERASNVFTIPSEFGWSDLGTWTSLFDTAEKTNDNNVISAKKIKIQDTSNSIIHISDNKLAVIRGLKNFIVVDEENALLIYPKNEEQAIKALVGELTMEFGDKYI